jgi:predicted AlkP superfamily pyrophosphatase or phosphodiesterase
MCGGRERALPDGRANVGDALIGRHGGVTGGRHGGLVNRSIPLVALVAACGGAPAAPEMGGGGGAAALEGGAPARVVMISIDGLMPEVYTAPDAHGLKVPTLRRLAAGGAFASRVESVFPTVTYPAHTTLVTGAPPAVHGITTNKAPDPREANQGGWRWYSEDIAVPTLWQEVEASGRSAALITWPVTVGADVHYRVPEIWRAGTADDQKLVRALATPGLLEAVAAEHPTLWAELTPPEIHDDAQFAIARHLTAQADPQLVLMHVWATDDAQHAGGPWSAPAVAAIEHVDALLGELVGELERSPAWSRTVVVVVSDHGFAAVQHEIRLGALFAAQGLITVDAAGKVSGARVSTAASGGTALVYADDPAAEAEIRAAVTSLGDAVARVYERDELAAAGADPRAFLALAAAPGHGFSDARTTPVIAPATIGGTHGWPPTDPAMASSFIAFGPRIAPRALGPIRMIDIAPTVATWLGVTLPGATGTPLEDLAR